MASRRASPPPAPALSGPLDLEITILSAKHLKNVNWRNGELKPYAVAYIDPDRRSATKPDEFGSTKPVWNERLPLLPLPVADTNNTDLSLVYLTVDVFHSKPSETPKPLVGTVRSPLSQLLVQNPNLVTLDLRRPSGRPHGNIRVKLFLKERPAPPPPPPPSEISYQIAPPPIAPSGYNYYTAPQPPPGTRNYSRYFPAPPPSPSPSYVVPYSYTSYSDPYPTYYSSPSAYYSAPTAPPPSRPTYYGGPSAPVDYSSGPSHYSEQKPKGGKATGFGSGLAIGAATGALGGLALEEAVKYDEDKIADRVESNLVARDDYGDYQDDF